MHVTITSVTTGDQPVENATIVASEMQRWLEQIEGFHGFLVLSREGTSLGLTFWESRDVAERHEATRTEFLERVMSVAGVRIEERLDYQVSFAQLGPLAIEPTPQ